MRGGQEWRLNCASCENRPDCLWCAAYGYLETGRLSAPVPYLCRVAEETKRYKLEWSARHWRYFRIAGITIRLETDFPMDQVRVSEALEPFEVQGPGTDLVTLRHVFELPDLTGKDLGVLIHRRAPWAIYRKGDGYLYVAISPDKEDAEPQRVAVFDADFSRGIIYNPPELEAMVRSEGFANLTLFPTDQLLVAQLLADRGACYMHASGAILEGQGLLFVGHSGAGKSTTTFMLKGQAEILCDDRIIVRREGKGFRIHGTWSHGDVPDVSSNSGPLKAILFLNKSDDNRLESLYDKKEILQRMLARVIRPLRTRNWWERTLELTEQMVSQVPCYEMHFDKSGRIVSILKDLVSDDIR